MSDTLRIDKWLWYARFFKTRSLASKVCADGHIRVNGRPVAKASHTLRAGDVLTFPLGHAIRVVAVLGLGERRGPASEAALLYNDMSDPPPPRETALNTLAFRTPGSGRPTKADRRATDALRGHE